jgi:hypothetical protein
MASFAVKGLLSLRPQCPRLYSFCFFAPQFLCLLTSSALKVLQFCGESDEYGR